MQGLLALLLLVFALWRLGSRLVREARDHESLTLAHGFRIAVLAMALGNIYGSPFSEGTVMGIFWALAALVERQSQLRAASTPVPAAKPTPRRAPPMVRA